MPHTFTNLLMHIIFSTKDRAPLITADLKPPLHAYMGGIIRELKGKALIINGTSDYVHLLVSVSPSLSLADAMRVLKTNSSRWAHEATHAAFNWQSGYGAFSVSQSNMQTVAEYIAHQEEHHRKLTFQDEYVMFLRKHGISYDESNLWN
ncbi:MAG TPA: IS200/IS605 family transposase [Pyrinomonadaceae bacterium]|nr:IS200/IS605 family transposase [Pyrinomonadaceae bacterium]